MLEHLRNRKNNLNFSFKFLLIKLLINKLFRVSAAIVLALGFLIGCTKTNQILDTAPAATGDETDLVSYKTTSAPTIDGVADSIWDNDTKLNVTSQVPDPGNGLFAGYQGTTYPATARSMYDDQNIYFLVKWNDPSNNLVQPWYFYPTTKLWAQSQHYCTLSYP